MSRNIKIEIGDIEVKAQLNDSPTAGLIRDALPIESVFNAWGDEVYFSIPVGAELECGREVVERGDLGYWPPGKAFCILYGKTPASQREEIRPASLVDIVAEVIGDHTVLKEAVCSSRCIRLERDQAFR